MSNNLIELLLVGTWETLYMVLLAGLITVIVGLPLGVVLTITRRGGLRHNFILNAILGFIVNVTRSVPFIILLIALIPITRWVVGTSIGTSAAIVPLSIGAIPFFARIVESALGEVSSGLIEAGHSMGASTGQLLWRMMLPEAMPAIINGITLMLIALVGYSAMAGTIGGGGLGAIAINYGYQRFDLSIMLATVIILVVIVYLIQWIGNIVLRKISH